MNLNYTHGATVTFEAGWTYNAYKINFFTSSENKILSENTGKPLEIIERDTDRDNFMTADEAKEYGLIDEILE